MLQLFAPSFFHAVRQLPVDEPGRMCRCNRPGWAPLGFRNRAWHGHWTLLAAHGSALGSILLASMLECRHKLPAGCYVSSSLSELHVLASGGCLR